MGESSEDDGFIVNAQMLDYFGSIIPALIGGGLSTFIYISPRLNYK